VTIKAGETGPQPKLSTTAVGDALRDQVIELLEAEGHKVSREVRVSSKKVDILLEIDEEFRPQTIAVECKNLGKNMSQVELNAIFADYSSSGRPALTAPA
jgi:DNA-binding sugar fermentation-stimulating protein